MIVCCHCADADMANQSEDASDTSSAQVVGNAFVSQYYCILHTNPEEVHKFYNSSSVLNRLGADGVMSSITTLEVSFVKRKA